MNEVLLERWSLFFWKGFLPHGKGFFQGDNDNIFETLFILDNVECTMSF